MPPLQPDQSSACDQWCASGNTRKPAAALFAHAIVASATTPTAKLRSVLSGTTCTAAAMVTATATAMEAVGTHGQWQSSTRLCACSSIITRHCLDDLQIGKGSVDATSSISPLKTSPKWVLPMRTRLLYCATTACLASGVSNEQPGIKHPGKKREKDGERGKEK